MQSRKIKVVFSVTNSICYDQRVLKMAGTLGIMGCEISITGRITDNDCPGEMIPFRTKRFRMLFRKGFLFYSFFNIRLFLHLLIIKCDLLVANDLDTLLPSYLVSKLRKIPLVYDSHEYFTGVPELAGRRFVTGVWEVIEKSIFPHLTHVITVSDSIAELYREKYGVKPLVIRNVSPYYGEVVPYSREFLGIDESDFLLILQGTGINVDKGAEELIDAINETTGVSLLIVGSGDVIGALKRKTGEYGLENRIKFFGPVDRTSLARFTSAADAGLCLEKNTNINYRFSLPNKLFDYIASGIPVICSDLPESGKIVKETGCGITISNITAEKICEAIDFLRSNRVVFLEMREKAKLASKQLNWENESKKVKMMYAAILKDITDGKK